MRGSFKVVLAVMVANAAIAVARFAAAILTGSSAMLSGAVHSLADTSSQGLMLYGLQLQPRSPEADQTAGQNAELYFWSYVVAVLLFAMGAGISLYEGFEKLNRPSPIESPDLNYIILGAAILLKGATMLMALRALPASRAATGPDVRTTATRDPALTTTAIEEIAAMTGLLIALAGVAAADLGGIEAADGIASIAIGLLLGVVAALAAVEVRSLLARQAPCSSEATSVRDQITAEAGPDTQAQILRTDLPHPAEGPEDTVKASAATETSAQSDGQGKPAHFSRPPHAKKGRRKRRR